MGRKGRRWHFHDIIDIQIIDPCYTEMTALKRRKKIIFGHPDSLQTPLLSHGSQQVSRVWKDCCGCGVSESCLVPAGLVFTNARDTQFKTSWIQNCLIAGV